MTLKKRRLLHAHIAVHHDVTTAARLELELCGGDASRVNRAKLVQRFADGDGAPHVSTIYGWLVDVLGPAAAYPNRRSPDPNMAREQAGQARGPMDSVDVEGPAGDEPRGQALGVLAYNGITIRDRDGKLNLTDMWKAGGGRSVAPACGMAALG